MSRGGWALVIGAVAAVAVAAKKKRRRSGYRSPGVYVEEIPPTPRPIEGVGTSTAGRVSDDPEEPEEPGKSGVLPPDD